MTDHDHEQANGWFEKYVVQRFEDLGDRMTVVEKKIDAVSQTVPRIDERTRTTAVLFGVLGGFLPAVAAFLYLLMRGHP